MPVKRRAPKKRYLKFSDEVLTLFRTGCEIIAAGDHDFWEEDGGRKSEYFDITKRLNWVLLDIHPGDDGPLDVEEAEQDGDDYEDGGGSPSTIASKPRARELHTALKREIRK